MKRSTDRILTTHVGSLIRPDSLQQFLRAKQGNKPYDDKAYQKCLSASVADVVDEPGESVDALQVGAGTGGYDAQCDREVLAPHLGGGSSGDGLEGVPLGLAGQVKPVHVATPHPIVVLLARVPPRFAASGIARR